MKEVDLQSLVIKAVRNKGGAAHKLSHRFLIGVSDLLVKLSNCPAVLLEAKLNKFSHTTTLSHRFDSGVTVLQREFLRKYYNAGMKCGVLSFVEHGRGSRAGRVAVFGLDKFDGAGYLRPQISDHTTFGDNREQTIYEIIERFVK